jgi:transposase-like protein
MGPDLGKRCDFHNAVDLQGRLSNPLDIPETPVAQGSQRIVGSSEGTETTRIRSSDDHAEGPRDEEGRLSNPLQRRLSPTDINDLVEAYRTGATISRLAVKFGVHRTTVAGHLDRHSIPRHNEQAAWDDETLRHAAELYATGSSLADVADQFGIDAQTVANRFRRAGVTVRPRRGWA